MEQTTAVGRCGSDGSGDAGDTLSNKGPDVYPSQGEIVGCSRACDPDEKHAWPASGIDDFGEFVLSADFSGRVVPPSAGAFPAIGALDHESSRAKGDGFVAILYRHKDNALWVDTDEDEGLLRVGWRIDFPG